MTATAAFLALCLVLSLIRGHRIAKERDALMEAQRLSLEDEGLMIQIETAEAAGSEWARRVLEAARTVQLALPAPDKAPAAPQRWRILKGADLDAYREDFAACGTPQERFKVIHRWHGKGFIFPPGLRRSILSGASNESTRDSHRKIFDEQDAAKRGLLP